MENLRGLSQTQTTLQGVVDTVLGQGLGRYKSPLESHQGELTDPAELPYARELRGLLSWAESSNAHVLITRADGLEFPIREMIRRSFPGYASTISVRIRKSTVSPSSWFSTAKSLFRRNMSIYHLDQPGCLKTTRKSLKPCNTERVAAVRRLFDEYVCFDTETTGKDTDYCEVVEARRRQGATGTDRQYLPQLDPYRATGVSSSL